MDVEERHDEHGAIFGREFVGSPDVGDVGHEVFMGERNLQKS